jgi:hypothetical protein
MRLPEEFYFPLLLLLIGVVAYLSPGIFDLSIFEKILALLTIICALEFAKGFMRLDPLSAKLYSAGISSLLIVISAFFFEMVLEILSLPTLYGKYLEGFGYLLAFLLTLIAALSNISNNLKL